MKHFIFSMLLCIWGCSVMFSWTAQAANITLLDVLQSTAEHHPRIQVALSEYDASVGKQLAAQGAFDWQINQSSSARTSGFYDGWLLDQSLSRRLPFANATVSGGYRIADGSFPIYENSNETLSGGEGNLAVSFSLLRDREIDARRNAVNNAQLQIQIAQQQLRATMNQLLFDASMHYLNWLQAHEQANAAQYLVDLALERQLGIQQKVQQGELAQISLTEFEVALFSRQANLVASRQAVKQSAIKLSLFLRDNKGEPLVVSNNHLPTFDIPSRLQIAPKPNEITLALANHPEVVAIERNVAQTRNEVRLDKNQLLPQLDLTVKVANDLGAGSQTLDGFESQVGLKFTVPLGQRKARGELSARQAKLQAELAKRQTLVESLHAQVKETTSVLEDINRLVGLREKQSDLAAKLLLQEDARFEAGDSDLFLLNQRENDSALARLALVDAKIGLLRQHLLVLAQTALIDTRLQTL